MASKSFWLRLREARAVQGLLVFLGASWLILQLLDVFIDNLGVPSWTMFGAVGLLTIGLVIQLSRVWVQAFELAKRDDLRGIEINADGVTRQDAALAGDADFKWARFALGGIFAFALLFGISGLYVLFADSAEGSTPEVAPLVSSVAPGVAVLPFEVSGTQLEEIGDGMANLLSTNLDGVGGLRAIDSRTVLARWDELVDGDGRADQATNLQVARATGARYGLLGSAVAVGDDVRLQADIYDVATGELLDRRQIEGSPDSVLSLLDRLSMEAMAVILGQTQESVPDLSVATVTTTSIPALKEYVDGEVAYRHADFESARAAYERAIAHDSSFALAYYQLSNTWGWSNGPGHPGAIENRRRAVELGDRLPERQALLVQATDELFLGELSTIDKLRDAVERYPDHAEAWYLLGDAYFHLGPRSLASPAEMNEAFARAVELDPKFVPFHIHLLDLSFPLRDSALAARRIARYGELASGSQFDRRARLQFDLAYGDVDTRAGAQLQLKTMRTEDLHPIASGYLNGCCWHAREPVLQTLYDYGDEDTQGYAAGQLASGALNHGEVRRALDLFDNPIVKPLHRTCQLALFSTLEFPLPEDELDADLAVGDLTDAKGMDPLCRALYAGHKGRWADFDRVVAYYESTEAQQDEEERARHYNDPVMLARALRGFQLWRQGQPEAAMPLAEEGFRDGVFAWWLGDIYEELGRDEDAARFYAAHYLFPPAFYRLGRVYERLGEPEKAREAYQTFINAWGEADPELQRWVEEASQGVYRTLDRPDT